MKVYTLIILLRAQSLVAIIWPVLYNKITTRISDESYWKYWNSVNRYCECGRKNYFPNKPRIIGGQEVFANEFPWAVSIIGNNTHLICGGSIINDFYIITAAHCQSVRYKKDEIKIVVGEHNICKASSRTVVFSIDKLIIHPKYNKKKYFADIMLIKVNMQITFNKFVRPICLPKFDARLNVGLRFGGQTVSVLGWGYANIPGETCTLRLANLTLFNPRDCPVKNQGKICAGFSKASRGPCTGDSGGPLQLLKRSGKFELIGVHSSGIGCGDTSFPDYYIDVSQMLPWILKITTQDSMYCLR
ncbi:ovochymase-2-like [Prorops nasuta]|uniref:ovochymase-2-like n=1 Tax=Prorops nasuta TaxID=863751 RepID=UPI0034CF9EF9